MSKMNRKLTDFTNGSGQQSTQDLEDKDDENKNRSTAEGRKDKGGKSSESTHVCDCYHEMKERYQERLDELGITPPACGHCIAYLSNKKSGTAQTYNSSLRMFIDRLHKQNRCIEDVEYTDVRDYFEFRATQARSQSTIGTDKAAINGVISRYEAEEKEFPVVSWKISKNIDPEDYSNSSVFERSGLEDDEILDLLSSAGDIRDKLMMLTTIETGSRNDATCLIEVSDVDLEKEEIELRNTKVGGTYIVPLTDSLATLLEHWINNVRKSYINNGNEGYLFPSRKGGRISKERYLKIVRETAEEAGMQEKLAEIPVTERQKEFLGIERDYRIKWKVDVHSLRHTFSKLLKRDGISKQTRVYALDHSTDVTDKYGEDKQSCRNEIRNKFNGVNVSSL